MPQPESQQALEEAEEIGDYEDMEIGHDFERPHHSDEGENFVVDREDDADDGDEELEGDYPEQW